MEEPTKEQTTEPTIEKSATSPQLSVPAAIVVAGLIIAGAILISNGSGIPGSQTQRAGTGLPTQPPGSPQLGNGNAPTVDVSGDDDPSKGDVNAPVVMIEFSDFQCPFCKRFYDETLSQVEEKYIKTGKVRLVFRDFPLAFHENAAKAAEAAECADEQGKFWEIHDTIFENQAAITVPDLKRYAGTLGLNTSQFDSCLDSGKYAEEVKKDFDEGTAAGVSGTPSFFINGKLLVGAQPFSAFEQIIEAELQK